LQVCPTEQIQLNGEGGSLLAIRLQLAVGVPLLSITVCCPLQFAAVAPSTLAAAALVEQLLRHILDTILIIFVYLKMPIFPLD
jgi:hypothetical protein